MKQIRIFKKRSFVGSSTRMKGKNRLRIPRPCSFGIMDCALNFVKPRPSLKTVEKEKRRAEFAHKGSASPECCTKDPRLPICEFKVF